LNIKIPKYIGITKSGAKIELHEDAVTQGFADFGKRGKGKSNLLGCMLEIFASRKQSFVVLDPPDAHWGIRFAADKNGKPCGPSGFDVLIVGGEHGDVPLDPHGGRELAQIIVEGDISAVICMKSLGYTEQQRFCADFGEELFKLNRTPRHIAFEEAHNFLPQSLKFDEQKRVLYAMQKIISEGRGSGLGFTLASQRPATVNKDALEMVDNFFALGMIGPNDLDQVERWFEHHVGGRAKKERAAQLEEIIRDIAGMGPGDCWLLSPDWREEIVKFHVRLRVTYHAGRTPKPGERPVNVKKFTMTDAVEKLKKLFAAKKQARQVEIQDLTQAKKTIRDLEKQLRTRSAEVKVETKTITVVDQKAIERAVREHDTKWRAHFQLCARRMSVASVAFGQIENQAIKAGKQLLEPLPPPDTPKFLAGNPTKGAGVQKMKPSGVGESPTRTQVVQPRQNKYVQYRPELTGLVNRPPPSNDGDLPNTLKKILKAIAEFHLLGVRAPSRSMVASWCKVKKTTGTFKNNLSMLRTRGLIENGENDTVSLTAIGLHEAGAVEPSATTRELLERAIKVFGGSAGKILTIIHSARGNHVGREDIAQQLGISSTTGTFKNNLSILRTAGMIEDGPNKTFRIADWMFID
jgi:uncharacterized protein